MDALHELQAIIEEQLLVLDGKSDKTDRGGTGELSMVWGEQSTVGGHASSFRCNRGAVREIHRAMLLSGGREVGLGQLRPDEVVLRELFGGVCGVRLLDQH